MSKNELIAKIEALNEWEALMEEAKAEAEAKGSETPEPASNLDE